MKVSRTLAAVAILLVPATLSAQATKAPMVDSLRHAPGKLTRNVNSAERPATLKAEAECRKVKLPAPGSDSTGTYYPVIVTGFVPPKSADFPNEYPLQFWLRVDAKGALKSTEYLKQPGKEFTTAFQAALKTAQFKPAIYQGCAVESWLIGRINAGPKK